MNIKITSKGFWAVLILAFVHFSSAQAVELQDLYAAEALMADDSTESRNKALSAALSKVLVRLSGNPHVNTHEGAPQVLAKAPSLVQQFKYRIEDIEPPAKLPEGQTAPTPEQLQKRYIWAKFDKVVVDRMMRQYGLPVWGKQQRPKVLLWLSREDGRKRYLHNLEADEWGRNALMAEAGRRGMPVQLPLMDLEDQTNLRVADLWSDFSEGIKTASSRYPHDVVLTGKLKRVGNAWRSTWTLFDRDSVESFDVAGLNWPRSLAAGVARAQDLLAERYAPVANGGGPQEVTVLFKKVESISDLGKLYKVLDAQEAVSRLNVQKAEDNWMLVSLWVNGGRDTLARGLSLSTALMVEPEIVDQVPVTHTPGEQAAPPVLPDADMVYHLVN